MFEDDLPNRPALPCVGFDLRHFLLGHGPVGFVVERCRDPAIGQIAHRAQKSHDRAAIGPANLFGQGVIVDDIAGEANHALFSILHSPPRKQGA